MSTVKATDLLAITRPSGGDAGTYKVAVSDLPHAVPATETAAGIVELATAAETTAGTDATRAVHPAGLKVELDKKAPLDSPALTGTPTVPSLNGGPLAGFRNQIINGDFRVNQRNGTRTPGVGVYGFDRWKGHAGGLEQIVEALPAGQWTLSWSGGGNGTFGGTTAASPITATVAGGNTSVVVPSAATNVQLEPGPVATPFEHRSIGTELVLCQRYFEASGTPGVSRRARWHTYNDGSGTVSTGRSGIPHYFKVQKRAAPTVSVYSFNGTAGAVSSTTGSATLTLGTNGLSLATTDLHCSLYYNSSRTNKEILSYWGDFWADAEL